MRRDADAERRARSVVFHSVDVLPDEVSAYVRDVLASRSWEVKAQILTDYQPLVDHLPAAYADWALAVLIEGRGAREGEWAEDTDLGIAGDALFFPAAHVRGPFLELLHRSEVDGLRLIHGLIDAATDAWRRARRRGGYGEPPLTPLPVVIDLPSGRREFWGNDDVYRWYRGASVAPEAVVTALMALEVWMERRLQAGRDADGLFRAVLADTGSVAAIGVCMGVALAYPEQCLRAALPLVCSSGVWAIDIARLASEPQATLELPTGEHAGLYRLRRERDGRPQRRLDVRDLAFRYGLSDDDSLRAPFERAVGRFAEDLPFPYAEHRDDPAMRAEIDKLARNYQVYADPGNYRTQQVGDHIAVRAEPPDDVRALNAGDVKRTRGLIEWLHVVNWVQNALEGDIIPLALTLEDAVAAAMGFQREGDFSTPRSDADDHPMGWYRLAAIVGVAAVVARTAFGQARGRELVPWVRGILLAAARMPAVAGRADSPGYPSPPYAMASVGLAALVAHGAGDAEVREEILRLVVGLSVDEIEALYQGLRAAWPVDRVLCWAAIALGLSRCAPGPGAASAARPAPGGDNPGDAGIAALDRSIAHLRDETLPALPRFPEGAAPFRYDAAAKILAHLPLSELCDDPECKPSLLLLVDDLMRWTVGRNTPAPGRPRDVPYQWNDFFLCWAAALSDVIDGPETKRHVLAPVRAAWPVAPQLMRDLLDGYLYNRIGFIDLPSARARREWDDLSGWVLDRLRGPDGAAPRTLDPDMVALVGRLIWVIGGRPTLDARWPHALLFRDSVERWIETVGHIPEAFTSLTVMLDGPGWAFAPEPALGWLTRCVESCADIRRLWQQNDNADRTTRLLGRLWASHEASLRGRADSLRAYSHLLDLLVATGRPMAHALRQNLERRPDHGSGGHE